MPGKENDRLLRQAVNPSTYVKAVDASETKALRQIRNIIDWHFADKKDEDEDFEL